MASSFWRRQLPLQARREAWLTLNLSALEHNVTQLVHHLPYPMALMAVLKADAYGHGAVAVWPVLQACGVSHIGVANIDEALQLRDAGCRLPILILGPSPAWALPMAWHYDLCLTVFSPTHLKAIEEARLPGPLGVHIKVDTGMHRIGIPWQEAPPLLQAVATSPCIRWQGMFTHMADGHTEATTLAQLTRWQHVLASLPPQGKPPWIHVANSATLLCQGQQLQASGSTLVRFGLAAYGYEPALPHSQPVMGLKARITHVQTVPAGEGVSYGHTWVASQPSVIATLPLGYADGVPRGLSDTLCVSVRGQHVPQVGRITMDQLMIDVTNVPNVAVGDVVTLLETGANPSLTLTPWADTLGTIPYELLCGLRVRLPRSYERL